MQPMRQRVAVETGLAPGLPRLFRSGNGRGERHSGTQPEMRQAASLPGRYNRLRCDSFSAGCFWHWS